MCVYNIISELGNAASRLPVETSETRQSGCQVIDVEFPSPLPETIGCLTFQNHYTHTLTLKFWQGQFSNLKSVSKWRTCISKLQLMPNCHYEQGSQNVVVLNRAHFTAPLENVGCLRLILRQPSPDWNQFGIGDLKCYSDPIPLHWNTTSGNENFTSSERMEQILQNGLWTETSDLELGPDTNKQHSYTITTLS